MSTYRRFNSLMRTTFLGTSDSAGRALDAVPGELIRPEGVRRYLIAIPDDAPPEGRPLVIVLHGGGASAAQVMGRAFPPSPLSLLLEVAAREPFVVVAPDAGEGGWADGCARSARAAGRDDVAFVDAIIARAIVEHGVDPARVHVVGVSRGGWMAYRIASAIPHRLAAFAAILAPMPESGPGSAPEVALPALIAGGTADPLLPYRGGKYRYAFNFMGRLRSIDDSVAVWRCLGGLDDAPATSTIVPGSGQCGTSVTRTVWGADPAGMQVELYRIDGGGHAEPSRLKRYPSFINWLTGRQNGDVEIAEAAWTFFREKRNARMSAGV
ncbi:alpha/beta fold hydrolase [Massilia pinisoli]|uniref:Alpha/beta fold hydrolase n=1 Tax=Massilia pinisoli TaxID=1772194 RepID=A0ABT1ZY12_9BURK|nr:alpha/beta fold hydrolase [Massilia pinisoli]MCS0584811.1 alpha/beta fold hydrolase [Massilia pinisoli]